MLTLNDIEKLRQAIKSDIIEVVDNRLAPIYSELVNLKDELIKLTKRVDEIERKLDVLSNEVLIIRQQLDTEIKIRSYMLEKFGMEIMEIKKFLNIA